MKICIVYTGEIVPVEGGGVASVIQNVVNKTADKIDYTILTTLNETSFRQIEKAYSSSVQIVGIRPLNVVLDCWRYLKHASHGEFDIVHFHEIPVTRTFLHFLRTSLKSSRLLHTYHSICLFNRIADAYQDFIFKRLIRFWNKIIVNSKYMLKILSRFGEFPISKTELIPNGVDIERIRNMKPIKLSGDLSLLFVGHLSHLKGSDILIEAFKEFSSRHDDDVHLYLAGSGRLQTFYQKSISDANLRRKIHFLGAVPQESVFRLLKGCDVCVIPSRWEAFSVVALEAMAAGKPIISTNVGGLPEIIKNGRNGLIIAPDTRQLADAMECLLWDEDLRLKFAKNSLRDITPFSWKNISKKYLSLYEALVS